MNGQPPKHVATVLLALWGVAVELMAASPSLTRLVPADAGLCVMAEQAASHVDRFVEGPLYARWQEFPPLAAWNRENRPALNRIRDELSQQLGLEVDDVWRRVFGRQAVLAVWPPEADQQQGPGLLLVEAEDAAVLSKLVAGIRDLQERSGELHNARFIIYRGVQYEERQVRRDGETVKVYLATLDRVGLLSSHASLIERAIDLHAVPPDRSSLAQLPAFQAALAQLDPSAPLKLFVNPRVWDSLLSRSLSVTEPEGRGQKLFIEAWRSAHYAAFCLRLEPAVRMEAFLAWDPAAEAKQLPELLGALAGTSSLLERFPANSLAAMAINFDAGRLLRAIGGAAATGEASRKRSAPEVIWSLVDATFQGLGPQLAAGLTAAPAESEFPIDAVAALAIQGRLATDDQAGGQRSIESLRSLLQAAVALAGAQGKPPEVKSQQIGNLEILSVSGLKDAPAGVEPAFAFQGRTMFIGSASRALGPIEPSQSLAARIKTLLPSRLSAPSQVFYLNLAELRQFLARDPDKLAGILTRDKPDTIDETRRGLEHLRGVLNLGDAAIVAARIDPAGIRLVASLTAGQ